MHINRDGGADSYAIARTGGLAVIAVTTSMIAHFLLP
jgi:hypothetical protein